MSCIPSVASPRAGRGPAAWGVTGGAEVVDGIGKERGDGTSAGNGTGRVSSPDGGGWAGVLA